jgi:hypothetical protein
VLEQYFTAGAYRFQMQFGRGTFAEFYRPSPGYEEVIKERRYWLERTEERCLVTDPAGRALLEDALVLARESGLAFGDRAPGDYRSRARWLGENWEPDYLLLEREGLRLVCGCVCFPSSWSVEEKLGLPIAQIHAVVPGLNVAIGRQIQVFLEKLKPGVSWTRSNWGLSRSPDRNQHPTRQLRRLEATVGLEDVFFRVEEQSLVALPETLGILFGIRIRIFPLRDFVGREAGAQLRHALETMPEDMARYKGIGPARARILSLLS